MAEWWVSSKKMTVWARTRKKIITDTAPLTRKFIGQPFDNLKQWLRSQGDLKVEKLCLSNSKGRKNHAKDS
jgi:hypothetical protein